MALATEFPASILTGVDPKRRTIRAEVNPMDKSTVVSIFPKPIHETKWTLMPGEFFIAPGSYEKPAILIVEPSSWWRDFDAEQPLLEIPVGSFQIAHSIVNDYCNSIFMSDMGDNMPGLFCIPGCKYNKENKASPELTLQWVKLEYKSWLDKANINQKNWYQSLVKAADHYWSKTGGSPLSISDDMRLAANELGLDRPWIKEMQAVTSVKCFGCGLLKNPQYPICPHCRTIDPNHPDAAKVKIAG